MSGQKIIHIDSSSNTKSKKSYFDYKFQSNDIILFGRESAGAPDYVHSSVNERLTIPMIKDLDLLILVVQLQ